MNPPSDNGDQTDRPDATGQSVADERRDSDPSGQDTATTSGQDTATTSGQDTATTSGQDTATTSAQDDGSDSPERTEPAAQTNKGTQRDGERRRSKSAKQAPRGDGSGKAALVSVQFRASGKIYDYDAGSLPLERGDKVLVQMSRGTDLATVVAPPRTVEAREIPRNTPRVVKRADSRALARLETNLQRARKAQRICAHRIRERNLPMRLTKAESTFDGSKITFYFFAEKRVDFRDLVRDLNKTLHTRIEMKHIGNRDETKMIGGVGPCGRELCCSSWLREFSSVSVRMAKEQGLSLKPSKLAGMCGRLKCCLRYEYETYRELGRALPNVGKKVESVKGNGTVIRQNRLKQSVILRVEEDDVEVEVLLDDLVQKRPQAQ